MKKRKMSVTSVGGSSILTIFAVLCFIVFALLSLSTAKANRVLADKTITATKNYYNADTKAEEILGELREGIVPDGVKKSGQNEYFYTCPIDDKQQIQVRVKVQDGNYQIQQWKKVYADEWQAEDSIEVFEGTEINE